MSEIVTVTRATERSDAVSRTTRPARRMTPDPPIILMGFADALAAIETAWSLQNSGFRVVAFQRPGRRPALRRVRGVELHAIPAPEDEARRAAAALDRLVRRLRPSAVLPLDDHSLWLTSRLPRIGAPVAGANGLAVECALDKSLQLKVAKQAGLAVPPTKIANDLTGVDPMELPVIVKPALAVCETNGALVRPTAMICATPQELARAARRPWHGPVLIQPMIRGEGEGLFGHVGSQGAFAWSAHRRVRMANPHGSGSSACRSVEVDDSIVEPSERFLDAIGWRGMFMLEFIRDRSGTPWFMELNGRAWGSIALARRRGFEYPAWTVSATLNPAFEPSVPIAPGHLMCRNIGLEVVHLMFVLRGPQTEAAIEWPKFRRAVLDVIRPERCARWYNWNRSQPDVLIADAIDTVGAYARRLRGRRR